MKPEALNAIIEHFIGLKAKLYSLITSDDTIKMLKCKGTKKYKVKKEIRHQQFIDVLENGKSLKYSQNMFKSEKHQVYSHNTTKVALSAFNDKKYLMNNKTGYSYGHYKIANPEEVCDNAVRILNVEDTIIKSLNELHTESEYPIIDKLQTYQRTKLSFERFERFKVEKRIRNTLRKNGKKSNRRKLTQQEIEIKKIEEARVNAAILADIYRDD